MKLFNLLWEVKFMNSFRLNKNEFLKNLEDIVAYIECFEEQKVLLEKIILK